MQNTQDQIHCLNGIWDFTPKGEAQQSISVPSQWTHGTAWDLPESWKQVTEATYEREITWPSQWSFESSHASTDEVVIRFKAVLLKCKVYINDELLGEHEGGFTPFELVLPEASLSPQKSAQLRVEVQGATSSFEGQAAQHQISYPLDFEEGVLPGGIWQSVYLISRPKVRIEKIHSYFMAEQETLEVEVQMSNHHLSSKNDMTLTLELEGEKQSLEISHGSPTKFQFNVSHLERWDIHQPTRYSLALELRSNAHETLHQRTHLLGLREFKIEGRDFYLNGKKIHLLGGSLVRTRITPLLQRKDYLRTLMLEYKELGMNCLRTHGSICPEEVLDVADEVGMLIENQSALWSTGVEAYLGGGDTLLNNTLREFEEWFERDREHPSVILWDVENELIRIRPEATPLVESLVDFFKQRDPSRPVLASGAAASPVGDIIHQHCISNTRGVIRRWRETNDERPLLMGEWWSDDARKSKLCMLRGGLSAMSRWPEHFKNQSDIDDAIGETYAQEIIEHRLLGASGTQPFSLEVFLFDPIFAKGQSIDLPMEGEHVHFHKADIQDQPSMVEVVRPYVNPQWNPSLPTSNRNEKVWQLTAEAMHYFLVGFLEQTSSYEQAQSAQHTLAMVNDARQALSLKLRIYLQSDQDDRQSIVYEQQQLQLEAGEHWEQVIDLNLPSELLGAAHWRMEADIVLEDGSTHNYARNTPSFTILPQTKTPWSQPTWKSHKIHLNGRAPHVKSWLDKQAAPLGDADESRIWLLGEQCDLSRETVQTHLEAGGVVIGLQCHEAPTWLFPLFEHKSSISRGERSHTRWGTDALTREYQGSYELAVLAPEHPIFKDLTLKASPSYPNGHIGPWGGELLAKDAQSWGKDERLLDDSYRIHKASRLESTGRVKVLVSGNSLDTAGLIELSVGRGQLYLSQLHFEENLERCPEARTLFCNMLQHASEKVTSEDTNPSCRVAIACDISQPRREHLEQHFSTWGVQTIEASQLKAKDLIITQDPEAKAPKGVHRVQLKKGHIHTAQHRWISSQSGWKGALSGRSHLLVDDLIDSTQLELLDPHPAFHSSIIAFDYQVSGDKGPLRIHEAMGDLWQMNIDEHQAQHHRTCLSLLDIEDPAIQANWLSILSSFGALATWSPKFKVLSNPQVDMVCSPDVPLDGDLDKWTNEESDLNLAPWAKAEPFKLLADPKTKALEMEQKGQLGALGYLMNSSSSIYLSLLVVGPSPRLPEVGEAPWNATGLELMINGVKLYVCIDQAGDLNCNINIAVADEIKAQLDMSITRNLQLASLKNISQLPQQPNDGETYLFQLKMPWALLGKSKAPLGEQLAFKMKCFISQDGVQGKIGDLISAGYHPLTDEHMDMSIKVSDQLRYDQ